MVYVGVHCTVTYLLPAGQAYFTLFTNMRREEGFPVSREKVRLEVGRGQVDTSAHAGWERVVGRPISYSG
jgi:hypothetical protein